MADRQPVNRAIAKKPVDALDDLRFDRLEHRRKGAGYDDTQRPAASFADGKSQPFGGAVLRILVTDNFAPARHDRALLEAEAPERSTADIGHQLADGARAARPLRGACI